MSATAKGETTRKAQPKQSKARHTKETISDGYLSPALRDFPAECLQLGPLTGSKAQIYNRLRRPIADGRMKTGVRLNDTDLQKVFGASRTNIRIVLERLVAQGCVYIAPWQGTRVCEPSPAEVLEVFETLDLAMVHIIKALTAPERLHTPRERQLIEMHLKAQGEADQAGDPIVAHLLGIEFLVLLAALHGATLLTDLVSRTVVLHTLSLKLYGRFPPPPWYVDFQRGLSTAILAYDTDAAIAEFKARHAGIRETIRFDDTRDFEEDDLTELLSP
jgi:DNA-binding GntR family transcriptional regulator